MKKLLSIILAAAMLLSLIPSVFAEGETTEEPVTYVYNFKPGLEGGGTRGDGIKNGNYDQYTDVRKWKYHDMSDGVESKYDAEGASVSDLAGFLNGNGLFFRPKDDDDQWLALQLEVPSAGIYTVSCKIYQRANSNAYVNNAFMSMFPADDFKVEQRTANTYLAQSGITFQASGSSHLTPDISSKNVLCVDEAGDDFIFLIGNGSANGYMVIQSLTLTKIPDDEIEIAFDVDEVNLGTNATQAVTATLTSRSAFAFSEIAYTTQNGDVATVDEDGVVTAVGTGETTLTARIGDATASIPVTVTESYVYNFDAGENVGYPTRTTIITEDTYSDYGSEESNPRLWMYHSMSDGLEKTYGDGSYNVAGFDAQTLIVKSAAAGDWLALQIKVPEPGIYSVDLGIQQKSGWKNGGFFCLYPVGYSGDFSSSDEYLIKKSIYYNNSNYSSRTDVTISSVATLAVSEENGSEFIFVVGSDTEGASSYVRNLTLTKVSDSVNLDADVITLEVGDEQTVTASLVSGKQLLACSEIDYSVADTSVAEVDETGKVTAKKSGSTTLTACIGDATASIPVTVTASDVEPEAAPIEIKYGVFVNEKACAADVTANDVALSEATGLANGTLNQGETLTAIAKDEASGYKFRYWVLGSAATGRYYSSEKTVTVTPYANIALTAIYTADSVGNVVDLFNYNGEFLQTLTNLSDLANVQPTMIGHTFANKWLIDETTELTAQITLTAPVTQAVAQYTKNPGYEAENVNNDSAYGWTRNGKLVTYDEDYTFLTWLNEVGTIERNTVEITDKIPLAVLESNGSAYMLEYDKGDYTIVEAGILFGKNAEPEVDSAYSKAKVKNIKAHGQFTASPMDTETTARGYIIYEDNGEYKVIYAD